MRGKRRWTREVRLKAISILLMIEFFSQSAYKGDPEQKKFRVRNFWMAPWQKIAPQTFLLLVS